MKRILWNIVLASVITLVAYIALSALWGTLLASVENPTVKLFLIALMTTLAFALFLLYTAKIRGLVGEKEVLSDYKEREYTSFLEEVKLILRRESKMFICIASIVLICFLLNTFDSVVFGKKTISFPTFFFAPMCLFDTVFGVPFLGYAVSAVLDALFYMIFLLAYRKRKYNEWMKNRV